MLTGAIFTLTTTFEGETLMTHKKSSEQISCKSFKL